MSADRDTPKPDAGPDCDLDECRFFDAETHQYGYAVACIAAHGCGYWREMFRLPSTQELPS